MITPSLVSAFNGHDRPFLHCDFLPPALDAASQRGRGGRRRGRDCGRCPPEDAPWDAGGGDEAGKCLISGGCNKWRLQ